MISSYAMTYPRLLAEHVKINSCVYLQQNFQLQNRYSVSFEMMPLHLCLSWIVAKTVLCTSVLSQQLVVVAQVSIINR